MITIAILTSVCFILGIILLFIGDIDEPISFVASTSMIGFIIGFIMATPFSEEWVKRTEVVKLELLKDNSSMSGNFFLGHGYIEGTMKYTYYVRKNNGFKLEQIDASSALIKYTKDEPRIETTSYTIEEFWQFGIDIFPPKEKEIVIFVPEGSIKSVYNLDAE